jgi:hypothetical protein
MEAPTGLCRSCRWVTAELVRYTARPWDVSFACALRAEPQAPHVSSCLKYQREAGAD